MAGIVVRPRARLFHGHDWLFQSEVLKVFGNPKDGDLVSLKDGRDRFIGTAIYNSKSQIVARRISRRKQELDQEFFERRLRQALEYRTRRGIEGPARRLVWSESDGLPGVVLDEYDGILVLQALTMAMDLAIPTLLEAIRAVFGDRTVIERNDAPVRIAEGLEQRSGLIAGPPCEEREIEISGIRFYIDPLHGHKTGFYLDQVDNYRAVAAFAKGRRVLDCFSNQGAFALACAAAGAASVTAVEASADCVKQAARNAVLNGVQVDWVEANVFDFLTQAEREERPYDLVILDPPSFAKTKGNLTDAMRGYKEIHLKALKLLTEEGILATFCCAHHVTEPIFDEMITDAAVDARRSLRRIARLTQAADHPVLLGIPETEYLKGFLFERSPSR